LAQELPEPHATVERMVANCWVTNKCQALAAAGGGQRPGFTVLVTQPESATAADGFRYSSANFYGFAPAPTAVGARLDPSLFADVFERAKIGNNRRTSSRLPSFSYRHLLWPSGLWLSGIRLVVHHRRRATPMRFSQLGIPSQGGLRPLGILLYRAEVM